MSQTKFAGKRIGYTAASQSFHEATEVTMLATNLLKKDFNSGNPYEAGLAISCLSNILTPDLARDLAPDVVTMLSSSRNYVKKRATLVLYKVFLKYPDSLRPSFPRLKARLTDEDPGVVSAAVNVVAELAKRNPKNYLSLAPILFKILTESQNNWMLIKIVKLLASLAPVEPRLARKLVEPLTSLMNATPAMSLLYECIQLCTVGLAQHVPIMRLCLAKLRLFIEDQDQNLKYLGLVALGDIMAIHPKAVAEHRDVILACLDDEDITIRHRALSLLNGLVSKKNLADIVRKLLDHAHQAEVAVTAGGADGDDEYDREDPVAAAAAADAAEAAAAEAGGAGGGGGALPSATASSNRSYADDVVHKIVELCSLTNYAFLSDFEWYISVLIELTRVRGMASGRLIAAQFTNVAVRVPSVRAAAVVQLSALLAERRLLVGNMRRGGPSEALAAAAFVCGEYASEVEAPAQVIGSLLQAGAVSLPGHVQSAYVQAALKLFAHIVATKDGGDALAESMREQLAVFAESPHLEVQERACFARELLALFRELRATAPTAGAELASLFFAEQFKPVAAVAQRKVPRPAGLDLDARIGPPIPDEKEEAFGAAGDDDDYFGDMGNGGGFDDERGGDDDFGYAYDKSSSLAPDEQRRVAEQRRAERAANPFILGGGGGGGGGDKRRGPKRNDDDDYIPVVQLDKSDVGVDVLGARPLARPRQQRRPVEVIADDELPENALPDDAVVKPKVAGDIFGDIDLSTPLRQDELLKNPTHRVATAAAPAARGGAAATRGAAARGAPARGGRGGAPTRGAPVAARGARGAARGGRGAPAGATRGGRGGAAAAGGAAPAAAAAAAAPAAAPSAAAAAPEAASSVVASNDKIALSYVLRLNPKEPSKLMLLWSATGSAAPTALVLEDNMTLTPVGDNKFAAGASELRQICKISDVTAPLRVKGSLKYEGGALDFTLRLPASAFLTPKKISEDEFSALLQRPGLFAAARPVDAADFRPFVTKLAKTLHLAIVSHSTTPNVALLYAESSQNHRVCVAVRQRENSKVCNVDIKATNRQLSDMLCAEAESLKDGAASPAK
jgi:hypothetical protein